MRFDVQVSGLFVVSSGDDEEAVLQFYLESCLFICFIKLRAVALLISIMVICWYGAFFYAEDTN
jgi:hypothetical protein